MLTRKIIFCALAMLCIAAGAAAQEENYFDYPQKPADPALPPLVDPNISEPEFLVDPMPAILPREPSAEEGEYSFNEIMEEIRNHEGKEGKKKHSNSPKRGAKPSKKGDKKHGHPSDVATSNEDQGDMDNLSSPYNPDDSISSSQGKHMRKFKKFSKKGRIVFGVIFIILASATLFCCVRKCKKRRQARKERRSALAA